MQSETLRPRVSDGASLSPKQEKTEVPAQVGRQEGNKAFLSLLFVSFRPSVDGVMPTHIREGSSLTEFTDSNANLIQKHPGRVYPLSVFRRSV